MSSSKYFIYLAYQGTRYQGWQRQANGVGIQEIVEDKLSAMFKQPVITHACGRTDAGVHASQFFCHTTLEKNWTFDAVFRINKMLPPDIRVLDFIPVDSTANAQLDVRTRTYTYYFHLNHSPFLAPLSTYVEMPRPRIDEMQKAASLLKNYSDFRSFCKQPDIHPSTRCIVSEANLVANQNNTQFRFQITANRFLKSMVRMLVIGLNTNYT